MDPTKLQEIVAELASKPRHEKVRANIYQLLIDGLGARRSEVDFEKRVPEARGRIDALLGRTVFEFKSDLARELRDAEEELGRYLPEREAATSGRFVGIATDGSDYRAYEMQEGALVLLRTFRASVAEPRALLVWLDGAAAIGADLPPDALTLKTELGKESIAFRRAEAELARIWAALFDQPAVQLKRQIWRQLLSIVYGKAIDDDALWFQHTFLVVVAKAIAARSVDFPLPEPHDLLSGKAFEDAGISGAVESDFFDWVLADLRGVDLVRKIANHVARFRLNEAKIDVLKILYESLIDPAQRKELGEYYTPDWLAAKVCRAAIKNPAQDTVLDPACGSGTFLFHAVRLRLAAIGAEDRDRAAQCCRAIAGMDIHPVAVIIARVTYLLALGDALRDPRRGAIALPVYLGDALQWNVRREKEYVSMFEATELLIKVPARPGASPSASRRCISRRALAKTRKSSTSLSSSCRKALSPISQKRRLRRRSNALKRLTRKRLRSCSTPMSGM